MTLTATTKRVVLFEAVQQRDQAIAELEAKIEQLELVQVENQRLTFSDVVDGWLKPTIEDGIEKDRIERPAFFKDVRCGYKTISNWIETAKKELSQPVLIK